MPQTRENITSSQTQQITYVDYNIGDFDFRAFYDADDNLIFVVDNTISTLRPNVSLIINPDGDRKWDDILENDYNIDLESVRPKKDNKYQKLDIDYDGLDVYAKLISAHNTNGDIDTAINQLYRFRDMAGRRAAAMRLSAAEAASDAARDTITRTEQTISQLKAQIRQQKSKLTAERKTIGRVPTKQSASKILRAEAQIDDASDKLKRAQRRATNAKKRLVAAENEIEIARQILGTPYEYDSDTTSRTTPVARVRPVSAKSNTPVFHVIDDEEDINDKIDDDIDDNINDEPDFNDIDDTPQEPKVDTMAQDEVKPLFDEDPKILDDEIAFKPIAFDAPDVDTTPESTGPTPNVNSTPTPAPLSFTPPTVDNTFASSDKTFEPISTPVLDTMTPIETPAENDTLNVYPQLSDSELLPSQMADAQQYDSAPSSPAPVVPIDTPVSDPEPATPPIAPAAPTPTMARPVSPLTGSSVNGMGTKSNDEPHRPTLMYYIMLILLIGLSIFTLWLYQRSTNDTIPDLSAKTEPVTEQQSSAFIEPQATPDVAPVSIPEPAPEPVVEPEPIPVVEPEPAPVAEPEPTPTEVPIVPVSETTPEPVVSDGPFLSEPLVQEPAKPLIDLNAVNKPAYNAGSTNDNMFVAADEYESSAPAPAQPVTIDDQNDYDIAPVDAMVPEYLTTAPTTEVVSEQINECADGNPPDAHGCCAGEMFNNGQCCADDGQCFDPLV